MLTSAQYTGHAGIFCPNCESSEIVETLPVQRLRRSAWIPMTCEKCGATWNETFAMDGYAKLVVDGIVVYQSSQEA